MELKGLDTALTVLSHFTAENGRWGVRELSAKTGIASSVVQRILATYQRHGFLRQCPETRKYSLGVRLWELGTLFRSQFRIEDAVTDLLHKTAIESGETVYLNMLDGDRAVCVQISDGPESVKVAIRLGEGTPLLAGSRGKVLLAFLPEAEQASILAAAFGTLVEPEAASRRATLTQELGIVRAQGWCKTHGERLMDVVGISVPIFDRRNAVFASVTIGGPSARMTEDKVADCIPRLLAVGAELQQHFQKFA